MVDTNGEIDEEEGPLPDRPENAIAQRDVVNDNRDATSASRTVAEIIQLFRNRAFDGADYGDDQFAEIEKIVSLNDNENSGRHRIIADTLPIYDEFVCWFSNIADMFCVLVLFGSKRITKPKSKAIFIVTAAIFSQLLAIRKLILSGLDLPAKQVLRCLVEYVDLGVRLSLDDSMVSEFLFFDRLKGPRGAKAFWAKYLRKTRNSHLRSHLYARLESAMGKRATAQFIKFRAEEESVLNACTHPSKIASAINVTGTRYLSLPDEAVSLPYYGLVDDSSTRTLDYAIMTMLDYAYYGYLPTWDDLTPKSRAGAEVRNFFKNGCDCIRRQRIVVLGLADYLAEKVNRGRAVERAARKASGAGAVRRRN